MLLLAVIFFCCLFNLLFHPSLLLRALQQQSLQPHLLTLPSTATIWQAFLQNSRVEATQWAAVWCASSKALAWHAFQLVQVIKREEWVQLISSWVVLSAVDKRSKHLWNEVNVFFSQSPLTFILCLSALNTFWLSLYFVSYCSVYAGNRRKIRPVSSSGILQTDFGRFLVQLVIKEWCY